MTKFWLYITLALLAILAAFASQSTSDGYSWIGGIWGLTGCMPWVLVLAFITPNANLSLANISVMSAVNAVLIFWICKAQQRQGPLLSNMAFLLGQLLARTRKNHRLP